VEYVPLPRVFHGVAIHAARGRARFPATSRDASSNSKSPTGVPLASRAMCSLPTALPRAPAATPTRACPALRRTGAGAATHGRSQPRGSGRGHAGVTGQPLRCRGDLGLPEAQCARAGLRRDQAGRLRRGGRCGEVQTCGIRTEPALEGLRWRGGRVEGERGGARPRASPRWRCTSVTSGTASSTCSRSSARCTQGIGGPGCLGESPALRVYRTGGQRVQEEEDAS